MSKRHDELSEKIFKMGFALIEEGDQDDDYIINRIGEFIILISGLIHDEDDIDLFGQLCGMFSAKKMLDTQMETGLLKPKTEEDLHNLLREMKNNFNEDDEDDSLDTDLDDDLK